MRFVSTLILILLPVLSWAQTETDSLLNELKGAREDTLKVKLLARLSLLSSNTSAPECQRYATQALVLSEKLNYKGGVASAYKSMGMCFYTQGDFTETLTNWEKALVAFDEAGDLVGKANMLNNIGVVYKDLGDASLALKYLFNSLKIAEQTGDKLRVASALGNIGATYSDSPLTRDKALPFLLNGVKLCQEVGDKRGIAVMSVNVGEIYMANGKLDSASYYFDQCFKNATDLGDTHTIPYVLSLMGKSYARRGDFTNAIRKHHEAVQVARVNEFDYEESIALAAFGETLTLQKNYSEALEAFERAQMLAQRVGSNKELKTIYEGMVDIYAKTQNFDKAFTYQQKLSVIKDSLFSENNARTIQRFRLEFDLEKKQAEINLLTKDKALQDANLQRQKNKFYGSVAIACLLVAVAFFLLKNIQIKTRANTILSQRNNEINQQKEEIAAQRDDIEKQKEEIEKLILNILPVEVAHELQKTGAASPRYYESVSIIFTDFKEFTQIAAGLSAQELVEELNNFFIAFDDIITRHGLEKIKTIGDAYMCASGIPTPDPDHAYHAVLAALDINQFIQENNAARIAYGKQPWQLRIGIHSGPVVAGVVGKKKFAYDIWGSTVNTANRLEASGEVGKVNISASTYELIRDRVHVTHRGKVQAKNMADVDMYFVDGIKS